MSQSTLTERPYSNSNLFSGHYLDERLQDREEWDCDDEARSVMDELQDLYEDEQGLVEGYNEDPLIQNWIDEVLDKLGFGTQVEVTLPDGGGQTDDLLFANEPTRREAAEIYLDTEDTTDLYERAISVVEAKQWDADFAARFSEERPYRNASHQIKHYLERTPENLQWGILTNGRKWRLYGTRDYETETYYEVDLPELLVSGDLQRFKYFYLFFRPAAFEESAGTTFLDTVWSESETAARELGEDLQDNVFTALRVLGRGFLETNDLDVDPDDERQLEELKNQSLVLLYRLMFVLYAEARGLLHPDDSDSEEEYDENFSLDRLRIEVHDTIGEVDTGFEGGYSEHSTQMWNRLETLFGLIRSGEESLGIPPYDGGLFDEDDHEFLTENEVSDQYLAEVIYRLSTTKNGDGRYVLADYADLDTRHLGSVYEGLLEHEFRVAPERYAAVSEGGGQVWRSAEEVTVANAVETVEEGGLYVVNDEGQRKATGAYYTPDYVVTYIVEETVGPLVDEIEEALESEGLDPGTEEFVFELSDRVLDLRVLDPAMGSGHFLTKATGYLAERVMERVRDVESDLGAVYDEQAFRRSVAKECIYGVDLNGMAVELAKLSMWLETLAADQPLAFLDHHFKEGNSLVGSDLEEIEELESNGNGDEGQSSLAEFGATREGTMERLRARTHELVAIENETLEDARAMKRKYREIEEDELRRRFEAMATVRTAAAFGVDVPGGAYERMARAIEDDDRWDQVEEQDWFETAQEIADEYDFLHWKLEFPEVFTADDPERDDAGFDVVLGNPPYVRVQRISEAMTGYLFDQYESCAEKTDLSLPFLELSTRLIHRSGSAGYVSTSQWLTTNYGESARAYLGSGRVSKILDFGTLPVFHGISTYPAVFILSKGGNSSLEYGRVEEQAGLNIDSLRHLEFTTVQYDQLDSAQWVMSELDLTDILFERNRVVELEELGHFHIGAITGCDEVFVLTPEEADERGLERELLYEYAHRNNEITRYGDVNPGHVVIYPYDETPHGETKLIDESVLEREYPNVYEHLQSNEGVLRDRKDSRKYYARGERWYQFLRPGDFEYVHPSKLLFRGLAKRSCVGWLDGETVFSGNNCPGYIPDNGRFADEYLVAILNSTLISTYLTRISPAKQQGYSRFNATDLNGIPIRAVDTDPETARVEELTSLCREQLTDSDFDIGPLSETIAGTPHEELYGLTTRLVDELRKKVNSRTALGLHLLDYITETPDGPSLDSIGLYQPPKSDDTNSELYRTASDDDLTKLKIGTVCVERPDETTAVIHATARYKPDDEDSHDTDTHGYTETEPIEAFRLTDLSELEADLVEAFVSAAAEEAGGFANFRENATKTISLVDRLKALTLPDPDAVENDLRNYLDAKARADELDERIERTKELIDEIVYELYGLTDEEVEIVEEAVGDD